jgi:hypothetical protein
MKLFLLFGIDSSRHVSFITYIAFLRQTSSITIQAFLMNQFELQPQLALLVTRTCVINRRQTPN